MWIVEVEGEARSIGCSYNYNITLTIHSILSNYFTVETITNCSLPITFCHVEVELG